MNGNDIGLSFEIRLRPWKSMQSRREPSFFRMKRTGLHGETEKVR